MTAALGVQPSTSAGGADTSTATASTKPQSLNGYKVSTFKKWASLVIPQLINLAVTAAFIFFGICTANPWMIGAAAFTGVVQAISLGNAWRVSKGNLDMSSIMTVAMFTQILGAHASLAFGAGFAPLGLKIFAGITYGIGTAYLVWATNHDAKIDALRSASP